MTVLTGARGTAASVSLQRGRIDAILTEALQYSLVEITAGPGYGKTQALTMFTRISGHLLWMQLDGADNHPPAFWEKLLRTIRADDPGFAGELAALGFPCGVGETDACIRIVLKHVPAGTKAMLVLDGFSSIRNPAVRLFVETLIARGMDRLCVAITCDRHDELSVKCIQSGGSVYQITGDELKFTPEETREYFALCGCALPEKTVREVQEITDGWPLALLLFALHYQKHPDDTESVDRVDLTLAYDLLDNACFSAYPEAARRLYVQLALLPCFSPALACAISEYGPEQAAGALRDCLMNKYDNVSGLRVFHPIYARLLRRKRRLLAPEELNALYRTAGDWFAANAHAVPAIDCYAQAREYGRLPELIRSLPYSALTAGQVERCLSLLDTLTDSVPPSSQPLVTYLSGYLHYRQRNLERADKILATLCRLLEKDGRAETGRLLRDARLLLAAICFARNQIGFITHVRAARACAPFENERAAPLPLHFEDHSFFFIPGRGPGALERMEDAVTEAALLLDDMSGGEDSGARSLFSAYAAYYTFAVDRAKRHAYKAAYHAASAHRRETACCANFLLAKLALLGGDYEDLSARIRMLDAHSTRYSHPALCGQLDCYRGWLFLRMEDYDRIPRWILGGGRDRGAQPHSRIQGMLVYAEYLLRQQNYHELPALLETLEPECSAHGMWTDRLRVEVFRAVCCLRTGEEAAALEWLHKAYDASHKNGIITPFIEFGANMRALVEAARRSGGAFDPAWLDSVGIKSSGYAKRQSSLADIHARRNGLNPQDAVRLSKRERELLQGLAQGLTQEELSDFYSLSVNTVKSYVKNLYNKLGAGNRAEAIHRATIQGLVD